MLFRSVDGGEILGTPMVKAILQEELGKDFSAQKFLEAVSAHADTTQDDMAAVLLRVQKGQGADFYVEELEVHRDDDLTIVSNFLEAGELDEQEVSRCLQELEEEQKEHLVVLLSFFPHSKTYQLSPIEDWTKRHVLPLSFSATDGA